MGIKKVQEKHFFVINHYLINRLAIYPCTKSSTDNAQISTNNQNAAQISFQLWDRSENVGFYLPTSVSAVSFKIMDVW